MEAVAKANSDAARGRARGGQANENASWQVRRPARFALLREHVAARSAHEQTPLGEDDEVAEAGRRLAERPPPSPPPLTPIQEMMKVATNETCRQLALKNSTGAHDSHVQATHLWMVRSLLDAAPTARAHAHTHTRTQPIPNRLPAVHGRRRQRRARPGAGLCRLRRAQRPHSNLIPTRSQSESSACCAQFPQFTTSCRQHMAHVGRALVKLRLDAEKPREVPYAEKKRRMVEHVKSRMDEMCCAQLPDGTEECAAKYCIIHVKRTMTKRATHVARKMTEANHPKAVEHFDVATQATGPHTRALPIPRAQPPTGALLICATQMSMDVVNPDLHHDPACRVSNHSSDVERLECMGKSILHHAAKQHGYDAETLQEKLNELNIDVSKGLVAAAKTFGYLREGHGQVKSAFFEKRAKDEAAASALMRESRARSEAKQAAAAGGAGWRRPGRATRALAAATGWGSTRCTRAACASSCKTRAA